MTALRCCSRPRGDFIKSLTHCRFFLKKKNVPMFPRLTTPPDCCVFPGKAIKRIWARVSNSWSRQTLLSPALCFFVLPLWSNAVQQVSPNVSVPAHGEVRGHAQLAGSHSVWDICSKGSLSVGRKASFGLTSRSWWWGRGGCDTLALRISGPSRELGLILSDVIASITQQSP